MFELLKEYQIQDLDLFKKYKHPALQWYKNYHLAKMEDMEYDVPKPPKDWKETGILAKDQLLVTGEKLYDTAGQASVFAVENSVKFSYAVD